MNKHLSAVMQRRGELLARIATQREQVAGIGARWQTPLSLADKGLTMMRFLRSHPLLVASAAALITIRRRGVSGLLRGGWRLWKGYRLLAALSEKFPGKS